MGAGSERSNRLGDGATQVSEPGKDPGQAREVTNMGHCALVTPIFPQRPSCPAHLGSLPIPLADLRMLKSSGPGRAMSPLLKAWVSGDLTPAEDKGAALHKGRGGLDREEQREEGGRGPPRGTIPGPHTLQEHLLNTLLLRVSDFLP